MSSIEEIPPEITKGIFTLLANSTALSIFGGEKVGKMVS